MKSRTSFFNPTLYKKDITRFAPLWILYTVVMMLIMLSLLSSHNYGNNQISGYLVDVVNDSVGPMSIMNLLYGLMAAQLLFGELFNSRLCNALHAMPLRRETRFGSHILAGLSFSILPNLLVSLLMMSYLGAWWYSSLFWLLAMTLEFLFFFGIGVLSVHCTGNRFAAVLVYAIVNFLSMAALWFASTIFVPLMPGVIIDWTPFSLFSPVVQMCTLGDFFEVEAVVNINYFQLGENWPYFWICAGVGVVSLLGALLIYRRRALESAGDFMAVKWLKPVFLVLYTLCVGAFLAVFGSIFGGDTYLAFLIVGFAVGFFTGSMLLDRTIRVFNLKNLLQLGVIVLLMWLALQAVQGDWFGIVRYVPQPESVKHATIQGYDYNRITTSDLEELKQLQKAHEAALAEQEACKHGDARYYRITYYMKDGRTVSRHYTLCGQSQASSEFGKVLRSPSATFGYKGHWDDYTRSVTSIEVDGLAREKFLDPGTWITFLDYMYYDCTQGYLSSERGGNPSHYVVTISRGNEAVQLRIRETSRAFDWLQDYEKRKMNEHLKKITSISLDGKLIDEAHYEELVQALYADAWEYTYEGWEIFETMKYDSPYTVQLHTDDLTPDEVLYIGEFTRNTYEWIKDYLYSVEVGA